MKRKLLIVLFSVGAVFGFAKGFAHLGAHHRDHRADHERQMVEMCVDAALRSQHSHHAPAPVTPGHTPPAPTMAAPATSGADSATGETSN